MYLGLGVSKIVKGSSLHTVECKVETPLTCLSQLLVSSALTSPGPGSLAASTAALPCRMWLLASDIAVLHSRPLLAKLAK